MCIAPKPLLRAARARIALVVGVAFFAAWIGSPDPAYAVNIIIQNTNEEGVGFNDPSPPDPVSTAGGNPGATLGEQREIAFRFAAEIWAEALDSPLDIIVDAAIMADTCEPNGSAVLGSARPENSLSRVPNAPRPDVWYPSALADRIAGFDLEPGEADIKARFNSRLDDPDCFGDVGWYYGLDNSPVPLDFVSTVLHELAHGLGVTSLVNFNSGAFPNGFPDAYSEKVFDLDQQKSWRDLTDTERLSSVVNVRRVVWSGAAVQAVSPNKLESGPPTIVPSREVPNFLGAINEAGFGVKLVTEDVSGPLVVVSAGIFCRQTLPNLQGAIVLAQTAANCSVQNAAIGAQRAGALALMGEARSSLVPPGDLDPLTNMPDLQIPVLHVSQNDTAALVAEAANAELALTLTSRAGLVGADSENRVYINASWPIQSGSSVAHWDPLTRREVNELNPKEDLLMEPVRGSIGADVDLTVALLEDIGWGLAVCGNGMPEGDEQCDDGNQDDTDGCNRLCQAEFCGDGEVNNDETCDDGDANSNTLPDSCRLDCKPFWCGDGVVDSREECDTGAVDGPECDLNCRFITGEGEGATGPNGSDTVGSGADLGGCSLVQGSTLWSDWSSRAVLFFGGLLGLLAVRRRRCAG